MELTIKHTRNYKGTVQLDDKIIMNLSQNFDKDGNMIGGIGTSVINRNLYRQNLEECRKQQDDFIAEMRKIEDQLTSAGGNND